MSTEVAHVDSLVSAVAEGHSVDWTALASKCRTVEERTLIEQLAVLATITRVAQADDEAAKNAATLSDNARVWGSLELREELGHGAFGRVYRARDPRLDREVAVKLFESGSTPDERFAREAQLLARIRHPHVVVVHGADVFAGVSGLWMEMIRGRSLRAIVKDDGPFGPHEAALIGLDLCSALAAVHSAGFVHRDIKAQNVMRETGGRIVLMDFGASINAGRNAQSAGTGTPLYMAPELLDGTEASVATDLYAVGVLLFFLLTGEYPFKEQTVANLRDAHVRGERRWLREIRPDVPAVLAHVVDKALSPKPTDRFRNAAEMEQALASTLGTRTHVSETRDHLESVGRRWLSRPLPAWATIGVLALAVPAAFFAGGWNTSAAIPPLAGTSPSLGVPGKPVPLTQEQWETIETQQELAALMADRGDWTQAVDRYQKVSELLLSQGWHDEPLRSHVRGKLAWAQLRAGQPDAAIKSLALGLYMLEQEGGRNHPLRATMLMTNAEAQHAKGDFAGAAASMVEAIRVRAGALAAAGCGSRNTALPDASLLAATLAVGPPSQDNDHDWIPDALERVVGLDAARADSDGDGLRDDEEDSLGNGISNGLAWAISADSSRVLAQFGSVDPERAGYRRERPFTGRPSTLPNGAPAWHLAADHQGHYYQRLTSVQKRQAVNAGWRLLSCGALGDGVSGIDVDLGPFGPRFDQNFLATDKRRFSLLLATSVMPRVGESIDLGPIGPWPATEFVYEPGRGARVTSGSHRRDGFNGHRQYQEDFGLLFHASNNIGAAPRGEVDFSLILLQIR